jgi:hypothetical protein
MANSSIYRILDALKSKVGADFSSGFSEVNLTDKVILGTVGEAVMSPSGTVDFIDYTTEHGLSMGNYRMTARFEVYVFIGGTTVSDRLKNALNLTSDVIKNITADRFLGLRTEENKIVVDDVLCNFTAVDGDRYGHDGMGIGYIEVVIPFQSRTGV